MFHVVSTYSEIIKHLLKHLEMSGMQPLWLFQKVILCGCSVFVTHYSLLYTARWKSLNSTQLLKPCIPWAHLTHSNSLFPTLPDTLEVTDCSRRRLVRLWCLCEWTTPNLCHCQSPATLSHVQSLCWVSSFGISMMWQASFAPGIVLKV